MSKLQKSAWFNLAMCVVFAMISTAGILYLASLNATGVGPLLKGIFVCVLISPGVYIFYRKKSLESRFDVREKMINRRAFIVAVLGLAIFLGSVCTFPFCILGGQNVVKVYYLPLIFIGTMLTAQFVHSAAILVMCALEDDDGQ